MGQVNQWLYLINRCFSNLLSESLFLLAVSTNPPRLKSRSTGALDGVGVLYFKKMFFMLKTDPESKGHSRTSSSPWLPFLPSRSPLALPQKRKSSSHLGWQTWWAHWQVSVLLLLQEKLCDTLLSEAPLLAPSYLHLSAIGVWILDNWQLREGHLCCAAHWQNESG